MRPRSLAELARLALSRDSFDPCLAEFLDEFRAAPNGAALSETPPLLAPAFGELGAVQDAYLAATAQELAREFALPGPDWPDGVERRLRKPWFASPLAALRAVRLLESPAGFLARNLFVSANALSHA